MGSGQILRPARDLVRPQNIAQPFRVEIRPPGGIMGKFGSFGSNSNALLLIYTVATYRCLLLVAFDVSPNIDPDITPSFEIVDLKCLRVYQ